RVRLDSANRLCKSFELRNRQSFRAVSPVNCDRLRADIPIRWCRQTRRILAHESHSTALSRFVNVSQPGLDSQAPHANPLICAPVLLTALVGGSLQIGGSGAYDTGPAQAGEGSSPYRRRCAPRYGSRRSRTVSWSSRVLGADGAR